MNSRRILGRAALVLCTAAIAAPAAQATFSDYCAGGTGGGAGAAPPRSLLPAEHGIGGRVAQQDARQAAKAAQKAKATQKQKWLKNKQKSGRM